MYTFNAGFLFDNLYKHNIQILFKAHILFDNVYLFQKKEEAEKDQHKHLHEKEKVKEMC